MAFSYSHEVPLGEELGEVLTAFREYQHTLQSNLSAAQMHVCDIERCWLSSSEMLRLQNNELQELFGSHNEVTCLLRCAMEEIQTLRRANRCLRKTLHDISDNDVSRSSNSLSSFTTARNEPPHDDITLSPVTDCASVDSSAFFPASPSAATTVESSDAGVSCVDRSSCVVMRHVTSSCSYVVTWRTSVAIARESMILHLEDSTHSSFRLMILPDPVMQRIYFRIRSCGLQTHQSRIACTFSITNPNTNTLITATPHSRTCGSVCICDIGLADAHEVHAQICLSDL